MVGRLVLSATPKKAGGLYFKSARKDDDRLQFIDSGCTLLNCVCSGGPRGAWPLGRGIVNIIGDTSVGKTLLAFEAGHNFCEQFPKGLIAYRETEGTLDLSYARGIGFPVDRVDFGPEGVDSTWDTIEDIFEDIGKFIAKCSQRKQPGLYIVDSLDGLISRADLKRKIDKGSYDLDKQKVMGKLCSYYIRKIKAARICVMFISQIRENIGVMFGKKYRRSGGKALDFYARLILWLSHIEFEKKGQGKLERAVGVRIRVRSSKNHLGGKAPRDCEFTIRFNFGVDDLGACLDWLHHVGRLTRMEMTNKQLDAVSLRSPNYDEIWGKARKVTYTVWDEVEKEFEPPRKKYLPNG